MSRIHIKISDTWSMLISPALGKWRQVGLWGSPASQFNLLRWVPGQRLSQARWTVGLRMTPNVVLWLPHASANKQTCSCIHMCTGTYSMVDTNLCPRTQHHSENIEENYLHLVLIYGKQMSKTLCFFCSFPLFKNYYFALHIYLSEGARSSGTRSYRQLSVNWVLETEPVLWKNSHCS